MENVFHVFNECRVAFVVIGGARTDLAVTLPFTTAMCDVLASEEDRVQCDAHVDELFSVTLVELMGATLTLICTGGVIMLGSTFAALARLNAPPNLDRLRRREARAKMMLVAQERALHDRQNEQTKISQAFRLLDAFQMFDIDASGTIDSNELETVLNTLGYNYTEAETAEMMREADVDGDGEIDYNEFIKMMMSSNKMDMNKIVDAAGGKGGKQGLG
jgi:hypothetical protein